MQANKKAKQFSAAEFQAQFPKHFEVFEAGLVEFQQDDPRAWREDFGGIKLPHTVALMTVFYQSEKGHLRAVQPNDITMLWNEEEQEWDDENHDE